VTARRQVLAGLAVQVETDGYRLASGLVDHAQPYRSVRRGNRLDPKRCLVGRRPVCRQINRQV
jgi:hypothetical protein